MSIQFEVSDDSRLLQAYYKIRESCFRRELELPSFDGGEDDFDRQGVIMIARDGSRCVGGVRLSAGLSTGHGTPLEHEGVALTSIFPQLEEGARYCQLTRLALLPAYRTPESVRKLIGASVALAAEREFDYAFNVAGMNRARLYKRLLTVLGYEYRIFEQVVIEPEEGFGALPHLLSVIKLGHWGEMLQPVMPAGRVLPRVA
jgi:hypothetical protein